ncbi:MAG: hypothetical protein B6D63_07315 [Candidatus Latescibacteria bacterium 4484_7]|nr:MAG: hypothetical protein B6D63_07315 [Candidatus Latescibacteria bacterium 4484_7]RKZ08237.1 MAG: hypothetical protein DRQ05_01835 [bacterium]
MFLGPVGKYALLNSKVRSRLSTLLPRETIQRLVRAKDVAEIFAMLSGTVYEKPFSEPEAKIDPKIAERGLLEREVEWHSELLHDLRGAEKDLVSLLLEGYELDNLKAALRIRESRKSQDELRYLVRSTLPHSLPYQAIATAKSIEDVASLLIGTPYSKPFERAIEDYKERGTLFPIETSLEMDLFRRLASQVEKLSKTDRAVARKLIGLEIDLKNINWLIRLKFYHNVPPGELEKYMIPGGSRIRIERLKKAFASDSPRDTLAAVLERSFAFASRVLESGEELSKLYMIEMILWDYLVDKARKTLAGFPFTIGTVLAYFILKRSEVRNLITIINGKLLDLDAESIEAQLRSNF